MGCRFSLIVALLVIAGCGSSEGPSRETAIKQPANSSKQLRLAVIPKGTTHEFWKSVHAGAVNAADDLGNVEIFWKGPFQENDRAGQIGVVQDFITKNVDGICLAPLDSQALVEYVEEATDVGIPVVVFDSGLDDESKIVTYVATDNYNGGALAARRMAELLNGKGDVILLRYNAGSDSTERREQGFLDTLAKENPDIRVLSSSEYAGTTPEEALDKSLQVLQKYKDDVDGIFAVCEPNAAGVLRALEELDLAGKVKFVGFDPNADLIHGLENGTVHGIVLQDPVSMGYKAVMAMVKHIQGHPTEKRVNTGEFVATPENMSSPEMQKLLKPQQFTD